MKSQGHASVLLKGLLVSTFISLSSTAAQAGICNGCVEPSFTYNLAASQVSDISQGPAVILETQDGQLLTGAEPVDSVQVLRQANSPATVVVITLHFIESIYKGLPTYGWIQHTISAGEALELQEVGRLKLRNVTVGDQYGQIQLDSLQLSYASNGELILQANGSAMFHPHRLQVQGQPAQERRFSINSRLVGN